MSFNYIEFKNKLFKKAPSKPLLSKRLNYICNLIVNAEVIGDIDFDKISTRDLDILKSKLELLEKKEKKINSIKRSIENFKPTLIEDDFI